MATWQDLSLEVKSAILQHVLQNLMIRHVSPTTRPYRAASGQRRKQLKSRRKGALQTTEPHIALLLVSKTFIDPLELERVLLSVAVVVLDNPFREPTNLTNSLIRNAHRLSYIHTIEFSSAETHQERIKNAYQWFHEGYQHAPSTTPERLSRLDRTQLKTQPHIVPCPRLAELQAALPSLQKIILPLDPSIRRTWSIGKYVDWCHTQLEAEEDEEHRQKLEEHSPFHGTNYWLGQDVASPCLLNASPDPVFQETCKQPGSARGCFALEACASDLSFTNPLMPGWYRSDLWSQSGPTPVPWLAALFRDVIKQKQAAPEVVIEYEERYSWGPTYVSLLQPSSFSLFYTHNV